MQEKYPGHFVLGMLLIALGLFSVAFFTSQAIKEAKRSNDLVSVTGSARKTVRSDYATWGVSVWCLNAETPPYECAKQRGQRIRSFLLEQGVPDSSITESPIRVEQMFDNSRMKGGGSEFIGFKCIQRIEVKTSQVDAVDKLTRDVSELIPELIEMSSEAPQYFFTKLPELRVAMLGEATLDAKTRAEMIAGSAGGKVRALRNAKMGVFQLTAPNSRDVRDYGTYDTSTIDKDVTAVVTASFSVE